METVQSDENKIPIETLNDYLNIISDLRKENIEKDDNQQFFFRGQANSKWDVSPSIFRNGLLSLESQIIEQAYSRNPLNFKAHDTAFERLTMLQHYGLSTRLLDITLNPLVAMFFACDPVVEIEEDSPQKIARDGSIYFTRTYGYGFNKPEMSILSALAELDMPSNLTIEKLVDTLEEKNIITNQYAKTHRNLHYREFIKILQSNYFVISNFSNERLIRQSGAFLLSGNINISINESDISKSLLQKAFSSLQSEFSPKIFEIPADKKESILDELNFYNINESSLFPEFERQMNYLKEGYIKKNKSNTVGIFSKINEPSTVPNDEEKEATTLEISDEKLQEIINISINKFVQKEMIANEIKKIFQENKLVDWYKKESVLSNIQSDIKKCLFSKPEFNAITSKLIASKIVENIRSSINDAII